jgi:4'-phosphopantetheinyl transferase
MIVHSGDGPVNRDLDAGRTAVWYWLTASLDASEADWIEAVLSDDERERRSRLRRVPDRRDFGAAHALLRTTLSGYAREIGPRDWRFERNAFGKPAIVAGQAGSPALTFSLTHTSGIVACGVARGHDVGIDVERSGRVTDPASIAHRYFAVSECEQLAACNADEYPVRFLEFWTLKEAYVKAVGRGLSLSLASFAFEFDTASGLRCHPHDDAVGWHFYLASLAADVRLAVATHGEGGEGAQGSHVSFHCMRTSGPRLELLRSG